MDVFIVPCPYCDEMFDDEDEFFYHVTVCEYEIGDDSTAECPACEQWYCTCCGCDCFLYDGGEDEDDAD